MSASNPNSPFPLETLNHDNVAPKSRLDNANIAQQIYWNLHQGNFGRNNYGAYLQGICDGNPPYRQSGLRASGQGWRANFNNRESKSRKDSAKTPYYDLFASGPTFADCITKEKGQIPAQDASGVITEEFHTMLDSWPAFDPNIWQMLDSFVGFGRGYLFWPQADIWHFSVVPWWKVRFPDGTGVDPDGWSLFSIQHEFDPVTLNSYVRDAKTAQAAGWNVKRVQEAIKNSVPYDPSSAKDMMAVQQMVTDQDIQLMYRASTIQAASIYVKEFDGTWSRMIVEVGKTSNSDAQLGDGDWLYYKRGVGEDIHEVLAPFIFEVETGSVNGLSGILQLITDTVKVVNRGECEQINNGFMRSTIVMQPSNASARVKSGLITVGGGVTLIPEGMQIQQSTILGDVQTSMAINQELRRNLDINSGIFRPQMEKPSGNPEPLGTTQLRYAQASVLTNSAVTRFLQQLDWCYTEIFRRAKRPVSSSSNAALKAAAAFRQNCKERGVSQKQLDSCTVRAARVIGNGSPAMRSQLTTELAQLMPVLGLGQRGRDALARMVIASRGGQSMVDLLKPREDAANIPTNQDREAMEENAVVKIGSPVIVVENDDHVVHLQHHFEAGFAALQAAQQGAPPQESASFIQGIMPHIVQHIQQLQNKQDQKNAMTMFKQLQQGLGKLLAAIQQQQPDPRQQQQVMSDIQLKQMDTQAKIQDRNVKTQAALQDKAAKTQQSMAIERAKARQRMVLDNATTASGIHRENATAFHDIRRDNALAANEMMLNGESNQE